MQAMVISTDAGMVDLVTREFEDIRAEALLARHADTVEMGIDALMCDIDDIIVDDPGFWLPVDDYLSS